MELRIIVQRWIYFINKFNNIYLRYSWKHVLKVYAKDRNILFYAMHTFDLEFVIMLLFYKSAKIDPTRRDDHIIVNDFFCPGDEWVLRFARLLDRATPRPWIPTWWAVLGLIEVKYRGGRWWLLSAWFSQHDEIIKFAWQRQLSRVVPASLLILHEDR